jgi:hypothetical protein
MTYSDRWVPQNINSAYKIRFTGLGSKSAFRRVGHCAQCNTTSANQFSIVDVDGSVSGTGRPTIIGSHRNWWNYSSACNFNKTIMNTWVCPKGEVSVSGKSH